MNIRIYQPNVRPYRVGLFEGVGSRYPGRVEIWASPVLWDGGESCQVKGVQMHYHHNTSKIGPIEWQKGLSLRGLVSHQDVVVVCGEPRNLAMMWLALKARIREIPVVWWGLHKMPNQNERNLKIRKWIMRRLATTILFYNKAGIEWLRSLGEDVTHVFATGNTVAQEPIKAAIRDWLGERLVEFRRKEGLVGKRIILACSRIIEKQRLHEAIEALSKEPLKRDDTILAVIGDGPLKDDCVALAKNLGVNDRIRWLGAMFDEKEMAPWFLSAKAFTYPGPVGLAILKALSYGLPAVINDTHNSTEAEIMENGKTGLLFKESDTEDLARALNDLMSDEKRWNEMSTYSKKIAYENYSMDSMVNNFCAAIEDAHAQALSWRK